MNNDDKLRRVKHLMYKHFYICGFVKYMKSVKAGVPYKTDQEIDEELQMHKSHLESCIKHYATKDLLTRVKENIEIYTLSKELKIDMYALWFEISKTRKQYKDAYNAKPLQEGRDNKDVLVGSGGGGRNRIRFPKKARKTAWKRFYKLFPMLNPDNK